MGNIELSNNEYQGLLDAQAEARTLKKELEKAQGEIENKNKAIEDERGKRKSLSEKINQYQAQISEKEKELEEIKTQYENFEDIKEKATKWEEFENTKQNEIEDKLKTLTYEIGPEVLEKHNKFLERLDGDLKVEYLENLKGVPKEDIKNNPEGDEKQKQPKLNERLSELEGRRNSLSPSEKVEYLTILSQEESK